MPHACKPWLTSQHSVTLTPTGVTRQRHHLVWHTSQQVSMAVDDTGLGLQVARAVYSCYQKLGKAGKPQAHEHAVLAAIGITYNPPDAPTQASAVQIVALGTGTKCLGGNSRSARGDLINDSHAEVLARRAFILWLHGEIRLAANQYRQSQQEAADSQGNAEGFSGVEYNHSTGQFHMRDGLRVHLYISQPPCGDACIVSIDDGDGAGNLCAMSAVTSNDADSAAGHKAADARHLPPVLTSDDSIEVKAKPAAAVGTSVPEDQHARGLSTQQASAEDGASHTPLPLKLRTGAKALRLTPGALSDPAQVQCGRSSSALVGQGNVHNMPATQQSADTASGPQQQPQQFHQLQGIERHRGRSQGVGECTVYLPQQGDVEAGPQQCGVIRRKPGRGDATLSLSCSDKIARWACCGLQGALLSGLLEEPVYLDTVVVAMQQDLADAGTDVQQKAHQAILRAVWGRLQGHAEHCLPSPYHLHMPEVLLVPPPPTHLGLSPSTQRRVAAGGSINWVAAPGSALQGTTASVSQPAGRTGAPSTQIAFSALQAKGTQEVTSDGYKAGASKAAVAAGKARSRLCRAVLAEQLLLTLKDVRAAGLSLGNSTSLQNDSTNSLLEPCSEQGNQTGDRDCSPSAVKAAAGFKVAGTMSSEGTFVPTHTLLQGAGENVGALSGVAGATGKQGTGPEATQATGTCADESPAGTSMQDVIMPAQYANLKQRFGQKYLHVWDLLRQQWPFHLWIDKPANLSQFEVAGFQ